MALPINEKQVERLLKAVCNVQFNFDYRGSMLPSKGPYMQQIYHINLKKR